MYKLAQVVCLAGTEIVLNMREEKKSNFRLALIDQNPCFSANRQTHFK